MKKNQLLIWICKIMKKYDEILAFYLCPVLVLILGIVGSSRSFSLDEENSSRGWSDLIQLKPGVTRHFPFVPGKTGTAARTSVSVVSAGGGGDTLSL